MHKQEFLAQLRRCLAELPQDELEERLTFYSEMLEDRMEEGLSEEEAVAAIGTVPEIAAQITADIPLAKIAREKIRPKRRLKTTEFVLLVLGSPIWLSLGIAAAAVLLALYATLWALIVSLWAVFGSLAASVVVCMPACALFALNGSGASGLAMLAAGLVCAGLAIFWFCGCRAATCGILMLTQRPVAWTKRRLIQKEEA